MQHSQRSLVANKTQHTMTSEGSERNSLVHKVVSKGPQITRNSLKSQLEHSTDALRLTKASIKPKNKIKQHKNKNIIVEVC